ncbi:related to aliphatic nitrilase [Ramularia collo-cygni]|uniref:Related to aliphatic nitrilase n=1 Tax=Ramularia collo-cygni TaxID=112498 RepID=A0A2D3UVR1_9PEZI|nr:related to aliphatic nitrilase [Ramularia collo-cygni]CZT14104.1 related to aliphatic nitrilase [Ramularia collo-cygni]
MAAWLPKVRVAACNVAPIFLDTAKTVQKTISLISEAARNKADLVVFPESYIPAFPLWAGVSAPIDNHSFFKTLARESLLINSPEITTLQQTCLQHNIFAHIGFNERSHSSLGCIWNASILISDTGKILNHHRKIAPTFYEKLVWAAGDGEGLRVVETGRCGRVGGLICGENTNPLARWTLMAQGEQVHVSTWPAVWPTVRVGERSEREGGEGAERQYDNVAANRTRSAAHCFEAKCFGVMCSGFMDRGMRDAIVKHAPSSAATLDSLTQGASCFLDPTGAQIGEQVQGEEGIAYADLDLNECIAPKQFHDVVGGYQRFDIFDLQVSRSRMGPENAFRGREEYKERDAPVPPIDEADDST